MKLFYTGAKSFGAAQTSPMDSLGGNISGTVIPNGGLNNLFDGVSDLAMENGLVDVRGIILRNTTGAVVNNVYLSHVYPVTDAKAKIEWSPITVPNGKSIEEISSGNSEPYNIAGWYEPIGEDNKILIASSIPIDGVLGLWIKRTVFSPNPADMILGKDLKDYLDALSKTESIVVSIDYT